MSVVSGGNRVAPAMPPVERERSSLDEDGSGGGSDSTQLNNRPRSKLQFLRVFEILNWV